MEVYRKTMPEFKKIFPEKTMTRSFKEKAIPSLWMKVLAVCFVLLCAYPIHRAHAEPWFKLKSGSVIVAEGDSLTYGQDNSEDGLPEPINHSIQPRSHAPYPETLGLLLKNCATVINHGFPGDRSVDGLVRWQNADAGRLNIIMYGSNDALNNGHAPTGKVNTATFKSVLKLLVERRKIQNNEVLILLPPPIKSAHANSLIEQYRSTARNFAQQNKVHFLDTVAVLKNLPNPWTTDGTHLSVEANTLIAHEIYKHISCSPE